MQNYVSQEWRNSTVIAGSEKAAKPTADRSQPSEGTALKHSTGPVSEAHNEYNVQKKCGIWGGTTLRKAVWWTGDAILKKERLNRC